MEENPFYGLNSTLSVGNIRGLLPRYAWTKTFVFLLTLACESRDRCFLYACYGNPLIYDIFNQKIVPLRLFHPAAHDWERAEDTTMWRLQNCVSNHTKTLKPAPAFTATLKLGKFFERVG